MVSRHHCGDLLHHTLFMIQPDNHSFLHLYMHVKLPFSFEAQAEKLNTSQVRDMKAACDHVGLVEKFPRGFTQLLAHITELSYDATPDYSMLRDLMASILRQRSSAGELMKYPWQVRVMKVEMV